jgi:protein phosphatase methylesterase 1
MSTSTSIFDRVENIIIDEDNNNHICVGLAGEESHSDICFLFIHGAGSSKYTWHFEVLRLRRFFGIIALDLRAHGESSNFDYHLSLSDIINDIICVIEKLNNFSNRRFILVGHSIGGSIAAKLAAHVDFASKVSGLLAIDLSEEIAIKSLPSMKTVLQAWPKHFLSIEDCIHWSVRERRPKSLWSAEISVPSLLEQGSDGRYTWRTNLLLCERYWHEWIAGFDDTFINTIQPHCLILSCIERLDDKLAAANMQGKFEMQVVHGSDGAHFVHEDHAEEVVCIIVNFLRSRGFISISQATDMIRHALSSNLSL